jgi:hypothetical protein
MSTRGINFVDQWLANNLPETASSDIISVNQLTRDLFSEADEVGISSTEIEEDLGSVYQVIFMAIVHQDAGLAD